MQFKYVNFFSVYTFFIGARMLCGVSIHNQCNQPALVMCDLEDSFSEVGNFV